LLNNRTISDSDEKTGKINICKKRIWLTIGIILLFVGVTIAPTINAIHRGETEGVTITTEIYGLSRVKSSTTQLAQEQVEKITQFCDSIEQQLSAIKTEYEAIEIFTNAISQFNEYNIISNEINIESYQRLISQIYKTQTKMNAFNNIQSYNDESFDEFFCLMASKGNGTMFFCTDLLTCFFLIRFGYFNNEFFLREGLYEKVEEFLLNRSSKKMFHFGSYMYLSPSWFFSLGPKNGIQTATQGYRYGILADFFIGIKINLPGQIYFCLGFVYFMQVRSFPPAPPSCPTADAPSPSINVVFLSWPMRVYFLKE